MINIHCQRRMAIYDMLPPRVREAVCYLDYIDDDLLKALVIKGQFMSEDQQLERVWRYHNRRVEYGEQQTGVSALVVGRIVK